MKDYRNEGEALTGLSYQATEAERAADRRAAWAGQQGRNAAEYRKPMSVRTARIVGWGIVVAVTVLWSGFLYWVAA